MSAVAAYLGGLLWQEVDQLNAISAKTKTISVPKSPSEKGFVSSVRRRTQELFDMVAIVAE